MGEETIQGVLRNFGLTEKEAEVYLFLSKHGILKCGEISKGMKRHTAQIYRILKILQSKGLLESTLEAPARFAAVPFETVLDREIKTKRDETTRMERARGELLAYWKTTRQPGMGLSLEKFTVIEGNEKILPKISQMVAESKTQLSASATVANLLRAEQFGIFDTILKHPLRTKIEFRFLTDITNQSVGSIQILTKGMRRAKFQLRSKRSDVGAQVSPRMVLRDREEALLFISPRKEATSNNRDDVCLWTDCKELVFAFAGIFEEMWNGGWEVEGTLPKTKPPAAVMIEDDEKAKQKYNKLLGSASREVILMTSSRGLKELSQDNQLLRRAIQRGVSIRIMAPIIDENQEAAKHLAKQTQVRHVDTGDLGTTIIDAKHLFQFKDLPIEQDISQPLYLGKAYYSDDFEYVNKVKATMEEVWTRAPLPSYAMWELSFGPSRVAAQSHGAGDLDVNIATRKPLTMTKGISGEIQDQTKGLPSMEHVRERWAHYERTKEPIVACGWRARAIIQLPNLPNKPMIGINVIHLDDTSAFGGGKLIEFSSWMETPLGQSFVPVACLLNAQGSMVMKQFYEGYPAAKNLVLVEPHREVEVFRKDNLVFAGWTVNIPLPSLDYALGPSCLFFEGHGPIQQFTRSYSVPAGYKGITEFKKCQAFVTFLNESQPYVGTGIQGILVTEYVMRTVHS